jgi:recombination protein RecT
MSKKATKQKEERALVKPMDKLKAVLSVESVQQQFRNALAENAGAFTASIIDLYGSDNYLQQCDPNQVVMEALKAATLKLPINKQLGFAWIVPYKVKGKPTPQFQIGYKGYIQLAMRTGQYRCINADAIYEGCEVEREILTGDIWIKGTPTSDKPIGYFAYFELLNGFSKTAYMTRAEMEAHGKRYSPSYGMANSAWTTDFDEMAKKTMIRQLLSKYGYLTTEMMTALTSDTEDVEDRVETEIEMEANTEELDMDMVIEMEVDEDGTHKPKTKESKQATMDGPGF